MPSLVPTEYLDWTLANFQSNLIFGQILDIQSIFNAQQIFADHCWVHISRVLPISRCSMNVFYYPILLMYSYLQDSDTDHEPKRRGSGHDHAELSGDPANIQARDPCYSLSHSRKLSLSLSKTTMLTAQQHEFRTLFFSLYLSLSPSFSLSRT